MRRGLSLPLLVGSTFLSAGAVSGQLLVTVEDGAVRVLGATPGGEVALLGIGRERFSQTSTRRFFHQAVLEAPELGEVELELDATIPKLSVWAVVDQVTGQLAISAPNGFSPGPIKSLVGRRDVGFVEVEALSEEVTLLLVRKGEGPWLFVGARERNLGSATGAHPKAGLQLVDFEVLTKSKSKPPMDLRTGDVLVAIDQATLEVSAIALP